MALTDFNVVEVNPPNVREKLVIHCSDGQQLVLVFVPWPAIDTYAGREMNQASRRLFVRANLNRLIPVIQHKYERDRHMLGQYQSLPKIDLDLSDLNQAGPLTDNVLEQQATYWGQQWTVRANLSPSTPRQASGHLNTLSSGGTTVEAHPPTAVQPSTGIDALRRPSQGTAPPAQGFASAFGPLRWSAAGAVDQTDLENVAAFVREVTPSFFEVRNGLIDLAPTTASYEALAPRIDAAKTAIDKLIEVCLRGNQQHAVLAEYAEQDQKALNKLGPTDPGICWYVVAQQIEAYRSNYIAQSKQQPGEYPPLEPALSTAIDTVVLTTGILALQFPEVAKSQEDFEKYEGRQLGIHQAQRKLVDDALSSLASSDGILTPAVTTVVQRVSELDTGVTPEEARETARINATKIGVFRAVLGIISKYVLEAAQKKVAGGIVETLYSHLIAYLLVVKPSLLSLAAQWPAMYGFIEALFRILGQS